MRVRYPGRLTHLALLNSVFRRTGQQREAVRRRYHEASTRGPDVVIDSVLERWFTDGFAAAHPDVLAVVRSRLAGNEPHGFLAAYRVFAEAVDEDAAQLGAIAVPTLVITGAGDVGSTPAMSAQLAECIPRAQLVVLDDVKHMLAVERAAWLSDALHDFVTDAD